MYYKPHVAERKIAAIFDTDEDGNPIEVSAESWETIGGCKCYDRSADMTTTVNGALFDYKYRVVLDRCMISAGEYIRVKDKKGSIRGEGVVINPSINDCLNYTEVWLK